MKKDYPKTSTTDNSDRNTNDFYPKRWFKSRMKSASKWIQKKCKLIEMGLHYKTKLR